MVYQATNGEGTVTSDGHQSSSDSTQTMAYPDSAVAVIGLACKFAGADSVEELWNILETGASRCGELPKDRFPDSRFERRAFKQDFKANVMDDINAFDHKFFGVASREAAFMDPQQRLALQLTYQALESAGHFARENSDMQRDMGCFFATTMAEYYENVATHAPSAFSLTGSIRPFIAGKVSHHFGFTGPSIMLDAACAASGAAVNQACRSVASGECNGAVVGATNVFVSPDTFQDLACGHFTSPTGPSRSFDAAADGYARGEGVAVLVLKKLSNAIRDGDVVRAVISATAVNQCSNASSITIPDGSSQANLYRKALRLAQLDACDISYVEAHGTGTRVGDPIEADSIRAVFGDRSGRARAKTYMGSLKSNIGHVEASAGLSGLIKAILMVEKGVIPQQALFNSLNPDIEPLEPYNIEIPTSNIRWNAERRAVCVNNYGASGTNSVAIVTQSPGTSGSSFAVFPDSFPVSITAFSPSSLRSYCSALLEFIQQSEPGDRLAADIAYHLSRRRNPELPFFVTAPISTLQELKDLLVSTLSGEPREIRPSKNPVVLFFGGQTGKTASVSRALYDSCAIFRKHLDTCEATLRRLGSASIYPAIFEPESPDRSVLAHTTLFCAQYANARTWIECGLQPSRLIGHSFGQLTVLSVSGVLSLDDALKLIVHRAHLIASTWGDDPGSMIAVELCRDELLDLLAQHADLSLEIACCNGARSFVLAGTTSCIDSLEAWLKASPEPYRYKRLQVQNAFHSALAQPLIDPLQQFTQSLHFRQSKIPLETCSNEITWPSATPSLVASHIRHPVYFDQAVARISEQLGPCTWFEIGSGSNVSMLRRALEPQDSSRNILSSKLDCSTSLASLAAVTTELWRLGLKIQFWPFHQDQRHQYQILNLPPYQFDKSRHWLEWKELGASTPKVDEHPEQTPLVQLIRKGKDDSEFEINTSSESWRVLCSGNYTLGLPTCSVSVLLDLVSSAIDTVQAASTQKGRIYDVRHLSIPTPISAISKSKLHLKLDRADSAQSWDFKLATASDRRHELASGTLSSPSSTRTDFTRLERLLDIIHIQNLNTDRESDSVRGRGVYKSVASLFEFPKSSQLVREVSVKKNEGFASLVSSPSTFPMAIENLVQIPLICLNGLREHQGEDIFTNTAIGEAQFRDLPDLSAGSDASWSVFFKFFDHIDSKIVCDMYVFDTSSRRLSAVVLDVSFSRIHMTSLRQALDATPASHHINPSEALGSTGVDAPPARVKNPSLPDNKSTQSGSQNVIQVLSDLLFRVADVDIGALHGAALIGDLGIDSLMGIEVVDEINKAFSVDIDIADFLSVTDVDSLCQLINSRATGFSYSPEGSLGTSLLGAEDFSVVDPSPESEISSDEKHIEVRSHSLNCSKPASLQLDAAFKAFDDIRGDFDGFARETGCDRFWSDIYPVQTVLIIAYIIEGFAKLGCDFPSLRAGDKVPNIPHLQKHDKLLRRLMYVLRDDGLIYRSGNDWIRAEKLLPAQVSSVKLFEEIQALFPQFAPEHELLHVAGSKLAECLDGTQNPLKLLFGSPERRKLMADQYHIAPIQSSVSRQLASFLKKCFGSYTANRPLQVLEVGGGTCGTTLYALKAFTELGIPVEYTFTDISPAFIAAAKSKLKEFGFVKYCTLDITQAPSEDFRGVFDLAIATNVIHATPNACLSAANVRQMLRPGGFFTLVEYTNMYPAGDVIFGQLDGWWLFEDGREHAIMNEGEWKATLGRAGYAGVDWTGSHTRESSIVRIFIAY